MGISKEIIIRKSKKVYLQRKRVNINITCLGKFKVQIFNCNHIYKKDTNKLQLLTVFNVHTCHKK